MVRLLASKESVARLGVAHREVTKLFSTAECACAEQAFASGAGRSLAHTPWHRAVYSCIARTACMIPFENRRRAVITAS